jgi:dUTP pyrophosphatase
MGARVLYTIEPCGRGLPAPAPATPGSSGVDLMAALEAPITLEPGARALIPAGLSVSVPRGYEWQIRPRSGLALRHGVTVLNSPGTVDADYRGPVGVILVNLGTEPFTVAGGQIPACWPGGGPGARAGGISSEPRGVGGCRHTVYRLARCGGPHDRARLQLQGRLRNTETWNYAILSSVRVTAREGPGNPVIEA